MPNPFQIAGAQPPRPSRKAPLYEGARWTSGQWSNRSQLRDAASTRLEERFYGPRGDSFLDGQNLEISQRLTVIRRPGNSVWNSNNWTNVNAFYEFRLFNASVENIKTMVDTSTTLYDGSNNTQVAIWTKLKNAGQSYMQSVGNTLFWGDGVSQKKWINTLQTRIPYSFTGTQQNPYNFTPFELNTFIIDSNGNAQQLIGTVLQLASFTILNNVATFTIKTTQSSPFGTITLPQSNEILTTGLQIYFPATSQVSKVLGQNNGVTLTVSSVGNGGVNSASVTVGNGGSGYLVGDVVTPIEAGASGATLQVTSVQTSGGSGYGGNLPGGWSTSTNGLGIGCKVTILVSSGVIIGFTPTAAGNGYSVGDLVFVNASSGSGGYGKVTAINGTGGVTALSILSGVVSGLSVTAAGSGYGGTTPLPTTGGTGTGLKPTLVTTANQFSCNVVYTGGPVTSVSIANPGNGYFIGDVLSLTESDHPQPSSSPAQVTVTNIQGSPGTVVINSGGPAVFSYSVGAVTYTTSGAGTGAAFSVTSVSLVNGFNQVSGINVTSGGSGFSVGDAIYVTQGSAAGCVLTVTGIGGGGAISTVSITSGGYTAYITATAVPTTTSGKGTGCTVDITGTSQGQITSVAIHTAGTGYALNDLVYPVQGAASGAVLQVTALSGTVVTGLTSTAQPGNTGYLYNTTLPTTGGHGTGLTVSLHTRIGVPIFIVPTIVSGGNGYQVGDVIFPTSPGSSGTLSFTVTSVSPAAGPIVAVSLTTPGYGFVSESNVPATGGSGTGAIFNLVVSNPDYLPSLNITDTPTVFVGGNPISDSRLTTQIPWASPGNTTIEGSALWYNRGAAIDGGLVYNWGIQDGNNTPTVVVNNAEDGWVADTYYNKWQIIVVSVGPNKYIQQIQTSGKSGSTTPSWSTTPGQLTVDGTAKWLCLGNDSDVTLNWVGDTKYSVGHILEATVGGVNCVFQLQPYAGVRTQGTNFPVYCWQCNNQHGSDVGAAGEIPSGSANAAMSPNGGQTTATATYSGTMNSFFLSTGGSPVTTSPITGDGTVGAPVALFPASQNLSISMLPSLVIPAAGIYNFQIGHQNAMFWGIGSGRIILNVTKVSVQGNVLTVTCDSAISQTITSGINLTFTNLATATFLNGQTVTVASVNGNTFTANLTHSNYGPSSDTGFADSGSTLVPSVISGPVQWPASGSPNTYNFSTGTPLRGYPIMSANYPTQGTSMVVDTVQISFPSAGVYPAELQYGFWYHSIAGYATPTVSPALPGTTFGFYMIYQPSGGSTWYNIIPDGIATSSALAPTWPAFPTTLANMQAIAPNYPSILEASGNYLWWNIGPSSTFAWTASVNYTTGTFIIDTNLNMEVPYVPGVSGTTQPAFATQLYGLVGDVTPLVWMNNGPVGSSPFGTLETSQGGWKYAVALVNTLDDTVSNASSVSVSTGNFFGATGVYISGGLPNIIDPQADYVAIFRTQDGGATYYLIPPPPSGNGNTEYTLPLSQYLSSGFTDTTLDSGLNTLFQAPLADQNTPPKIGSINCAYLDNRIFVSVGNTVFWSSGPDTPIGNGLNGFNPLNFAEFPSKVTRLVPLNVGMFVFTVSDVYLITGSGTSGDAFAAQPFLQRFGLISYNALTVNGSIIYLLTTDKQVMELNVHSGASHIGTPVADVIRNNFNPQSSYLTWHVDGDRDQCLFVADGTTGWYRMSPTAAPENGQITWSVKANIVNGCGAVQSIETAPGLIQLLVAPPPGITGPILVRDYTTNADNGISYPASFLLGSLVLAYPGQIAEVEFITTEAVKVPGSFPLTLAVRIGEIAGAFDPLVRWTDDPPQLTPSQTLYSQRFYMSQTGEPTIMRHMQIQGNFAATNTADELYTLTVYGGSMSEL